MCGNGFAQYSCVHTHKADKSGAFLRGSGSRRCGNAAWHGWNDTEPYRACRTREGCDGRIRYAIAAMPVIMNMLNMIGGMV